MKDFMMAVLPLLCMAIAVALLFALRGKKKKETDGQTETAKSGSYMHEGMCIGMLLGLLIGSKFSTIGMLLGLLIGGSIKKKV